MLAGPPSEKQPVGSDGDGDYRPLTPTLDLDWDERACKFFRFLSWSVAPLEPYFPSLPYFHIIKNVIIDADLIFHSQPCRLYPCTLPSHQPPTRLQYGDPAPLTKELP